MAGTSQTIRKVRVAKVADFDEQLWPINCAILILAGFALGIVVATSDFHDPNVLSNGWSRLISVAVMVGLLFWGVFWLQGKMRRRLQLCVLLGLLVHVWLGIWAHKEYLALLAEQEAARERMVEQHQQITVPDYHWQQIEEPDAHPSYEEPIESEAPRPAEPKAVRREAEPPRVAASVEPVEEPPIPQRQQPNPAVDRRTELSAPRRAEAAAGGQISRQRWKQLPMPNEPIPEPEIRPQTRQPATLPYAEIASREARQTRIQVDQLQTFEDSASVGEEPLPMKMARRATGPQPLSDVPTTPEPSRQVRLAAEAPRTEATAPEPLRIVQRVARPEQPRVKTPMTARRQAAPPRVVRPDSETPPAPMAPPAVGQAATRQRPIEEPPRLAETPRRTPTRRPRPLAVSSSVPGPQPDVVAVSGEPTRVDATPTRFPRRADLPTSPPSASVAQLAASPSLSTESPVVGRSTARRQQSPTQPLSEPFASQPTRVVLPQAVPQVAAIQIAETAVLARSTPADQPALPTARPNTTAVSRAADIATHLAQDQPPGRALPAMTSAAQIPSAVAARRPAASQLGRPGLDRVPARPSTLARDQGGVELPSIALAAPSLPAATPAGEGIAAASRIERLGSTAAVRRQGARPPSGDRIAPGGSEEMAIGSSQLVARTGQLRAVGTGRPSASTHGAAPRLSRDSAAVASAAASGAPRAGAVASEVKGPSIPAFNVRGSAAERGGRVREFALASAAGSGPAGSSGTPGPVGVAQQTRVTRYESVALAIAGSGAPNPGKTVGGAASPSSASQAPSATAIGAPAGGDASDLPPLRAPVSGPRHELAGLPGRLRSQPRTGAVGSFAAQGAPLSQAAARRAAVSSPGPGGSDLGSPETVTMRRTPGATDLAAATATPEDLGQVPTPGAGGVTSGQGALPSILEQRRSATVRRAAADVEVGSTTTAGATGEGGLGAADVVALAGQLRSGGRTVPSLPVSVGRLQIARSLAPGAGAASAGAVAAEPAMEAAVGGPGVEASGPRHLGTAPPAVTVASAKAPVAAVPPGPQPGAAAGPDDLPVPVTHGGRVSRDESLLATAAGAAAGPARSSGGLMGVGAGPGAPEAAQPGPSTGGADAAPRFSLRPNLTGLPRQTAGLAGHRIDRTMIEPAAQLGSAATTPGVARGPRRLPRGDMPEPALAAEVGRGPIRKSEAPGLPRGLARTVEEPAPAAAVGGQMGETFAPATGAGVGQPRRQEGGLPVQIAAVAGPGGLGYDPSPELGVPSRRARPESEIIHTVSRRFVIERSGGQLAIDGRIREAVAEAFRQREPGRRSQAVQAFGGSEGTERAVEMGLEFFARHQFPDGRWSLHGLPPDVQYEDAGLGQMRSDSAATGLALLTYLGAGYTHLSDKHRGVVKRGLDWLVRNQKENGDLFIDGERGTKYAWFYSHGIASIALCEAYGMTRDPELREPARKAIEFIVDTQHPIQGGWRYSLDERGRATETDTSVTGWMLMALKSAQMAGLDVPQETLEKIDGWLDSAEARSQIGQYVYNPYAKDDPTQRHGRAPNLAMTAEAMLMRMYLGYQRDDAGLMAGADHLMENLPAIGTRTKSLRDCYYWYYATQAMFQMQGDYWTAWHDRLRALVESSQIQSGQVAGSWDPLEPVEDRWGLHGGRLYVTSLHLLMLEVYYRHLPLFQELSK